MLKCKYITEKYFRLWCKNLLIFLGFSCQNWGSVSQRFLWKKLATLFEPSSAIRRDEKARVKYVRGRMEI